MKRRVGGSNNVDFVSPERRQRRISVLPDTEINLQINKKKLQCVSFFFVFFCTESRHYKATEENERKFQIERERKREAFTGNANRNKEAQCGFEVVHPRSLLQGGALKNAGISTTLRRSKNVPVCAFETRAIKDAPTLSRVRVFYRFAT